jgi:hypothetical protein
MRALHGDCNRTDFLHVNPRAEVPAQLDGAFALNDSTITAAVDAVRTAVVVHVEKYRRSQPQ